MINKEQETIDEGIISRLLMIIISAIGPRGNDLHYYMALWLVLILVPRLHDKWLLIF